MTSDKGEGPSVRKNKPDAEPSSPVTDDAARQLSDEADAAQAPREGGNTGAGNTDVTDDDNEGADVDFETESELEEEDVDSEGLRPDERQLIDNLIEQSAVAMSSPSRAVLKGKMNERRERLEREGRLERREASEETPESPTRPTAADLVLEKDEEILALQRPFEKILGSIYPDIGIEHDPWDLRKLIAALRDIGVFDYMKKLDPRKQHDFTKWTDLSYQTALVIFEKKYDEIDENGEALEEKDLWLLPDILKAIYKEASKQWVGAERSKKTRDALPSPDLDSPGDDAESDELPYTQAQLTDFVHHHSYEFTRGLTQWMEGVNKREDDSEKVQRRIVAGVKPLGIQIDMEGIEVRMKGPAPPPRRTKKPTKRVEVIEDDETEEESEEEAPAPPKPARKKSTAKPTVPKVKKTPFTDKNGEVCHFHVQGKKGLVIVKCKLNCGNQIHSSCMPGQKTKIWTCPECKMNENQEYSVPDDEGESDDDGDDDGGARGKHAQAARKNSARPKPQQSVAKPAKPVPKKPTQQTKDGKRKRVQQESDVGESDVGEADESAADDLEEPEPRPTKVRKVYGSDANSVKANAVKTNAVKTKVVNGIVTYPSGRPPLPEPAAFARGTIAGFNSKGDVVKHRR